MAVEKKRTLNGELRLKYGFGSVGLLPERTLDWQSINLLKFIFGSSKRNARLTGIVERIP